MPKRNMFKSQTLSAAAHGGCLKRVLGKAGQTAVSHSASIRNLSNCPHRKWNLLVFKLIADLCLLNEQTFKVLLVALGPRMKDFNGKLLSSQVRRIDLTEASTSNQSLQ